jgi:ribokinase
MSVAILDAAGDYGAVTVSGSNLEIDPGALELDDLWREAAMLMIQNEVAEHLNVAAAQAARQRGLRVSLNAAPVRPLPADLVAALDVIVVNALEAEAMCGVEVNDLGDAAEAARRLSDIVPVAVVTAGGAGAAVARRLGRSFALEAEAVTPVSTHGTGDVFTGTRVAALAAGRPLEEAVAVANGAAARHVAGLH